MPHVAFSPTSNEYLVVFEGDDDTPPLVDGESEIFGQRLDATQPTGYPTLLVNDGARHVITAGGPFLGSIAPDDEVDGRS